MENIETILTNRGERFCYARDGMIVFTCAENLRWLCFRSDYVFVSSNRTVLSTELLHFFPFFRFLAECETYLGDGTFDYSAKHFAQMYTIHGHKDNYNVRLAFCLLPNKQQKT